MSTIIRRDSRRSRKPSRVMAMGIVLLAGIAGVLALAWQRGGPQPVREVTIALATPEADQQALPGAGPGAGPAAGPGAGH